jgi:hypothetical protein
MRLIYLLCIFLQYVNLLLLAVGCWLLVIGYWLLAVGCWLLAFGCWLLAFGYWLLAANKCLLGDYCGSVHLFPFRTEKLSLPAQMVLGSHLGEYVVA